ncbi:MAG: DNA polymerase III subunit delta, partial [Raoultibacter sp.]
RNKRALTAKSFESLHQMTAIIRSWLRDVMTVCAGTPELVINVDARQAIEEAAALTDEARAAAALAAVRKADEALTYNVSPETCLDALLFEIRSILYGTSSSHKAAI